MQISNIKNQNLSAFTEDNSRKAVDECEGMKDTTGVSPWRLH